MKASTRDWITKAEEDFAAAIALARPRKKPLWAPVCFHAQQCVEKYLKARLNEASIQFYKTHDLEQLLRQALPSEPIWAALNDGLKRLTDSAVLPRYPGNFFSKSEAQQALNRSNAVGMGIATVPVAAIGVPPMAPASAKDKPFGVLSLRPIWPAGRRPVRARRARSPRRTASFRLKTCKAFRKEARASFGLPAK